MPRLLSQINGSGQVGIASDGTRLGNMSELNFESNRVKLSATGIATVTSDPLTIVGLRKTFLNLLVRQRKQRNALMVSIGVLIRKNVCQSLVDII